MVGYNADGPSRDRVMQLIQEKDRIESEIRDQSAILESNHVGMHDSLVDQEGFPRNDIDVYKVRYARHQIICLQNDHKNIMKRIERGLAEVHANLLSSSSESQSVNGPTTSSNGHLNGHMNGHSRDNNFGDSNNDAHDICFAIVGFVSVGSPADAATFHTTGCEQSVMLVMWIPDNGYNIQTTFLGLCEYDEILQFGSINHQNFRDMSQIMDIVGHSVGQRINVKIQRDHNILNVTVVPRPWQQPGLLGCQILRKQ